jgi:hypothetical protein
MKNVAARRFVFALVLSAASTAFAETITYATIDPSTATGTSGTIGGISYTYTGAYAFIDASDTGATNFFTPFSTYTSSTVSNTPTDGGLIAISDTGLTHTFTFSTPVTDLIFSEVSLGQPGIPTSYSFNSSFTVLSCGPNSYYGGACFSSGGVGTTGTVLQGNEDDGTIEFNGPISSLSFTTANGEYWNGFDIGLGAQTTSPTLTPEPSSFVLLGTGIAGLVGLARRRLVRQATTG